MHQKFTLHDRLKADTLKVTRLKLCQVLLMNDQNYPWFILVPERADITEIHHLAPSDQLQLMSEINTVSQAVEKTFTPNKINVAALGNMVSQLHIHITARYHSDPAWPNPIWGHIPAVPYSSDAGKTRIKSFLSNLR